MFWSQSSDKSHCLRLRIVDRSIVIVVSLHMYTGRKGNCLSLNLEDTDTAQVRTSRGLNVLQQPNILEYSKDYHVSTFGFQYIPSLLI